MGEIEYQKEEKFEYMEFKKLKEFDNLIAFFTLKSNNMGFRNKAKNGLDDLTRRTSTKIIANFLNNKANETSKYENEMNTLRNIVQLNQEHTDKILNIRDIDDISNDAYNINYINNKNIIENCNEERNLKAIPYDAVMTNLKNVATIITTADCMPIVIYDPVNKVFSNVHSGWKGTIQEIGIKAIYNMEKTYSSKPENLIFCIGPNIRKDHFLVNDDVKEIYEKKFKEMTKHYEIIATTDCYNDKGRQYRIDNTLIYRVLLKKIGVLDKNIIDSKICTVCNQNEFHSRRAEGIDYEVNGLVVMLK